jgi:hypothetical protein
MLLWNSNSPSSYTPPAPPPPAKSNFSLYFDGGGVISAFVVEYYYFRERTRVGLKERQHKIEGEETKTKKSTIKVRLGQY